MPYELKMKRLYVKFLQVKMLLKPAPAGFFCRAEMLFKTGFVLYTLQVTADVQLPGNDAGAAVKKIL